MAPPGRAGGVRRPPRRRAPAYTRPRPRGRQRRRARRGRAGVVRGGGARRDPRLPDGLEEGDRRLLGGERPQGLPLALDHGVPLVVPGGRHRYQAEVPPTAGACARARASSPPVGLAARTGSVRRPPQAARPGRPDRRPQGGQDGLASGAAALPGRHRLRTAPDERWAPGAERGKRRGLTCSVGGGGAGWGRRPGVPAGATSPRGGAGVRRGAPPAGSVAPGANPPLSQRTKARAWWM